MVGSSHHFTFFRVKDLIITLLKVWRMGHILGAHQNGWITTELFYEWVANHFLFDKHSTHIDLETTKRMMSCFIVPTPRILRNPWMLSLLGWHIVQKYL